MRLSEDSTGLLRVHHILQVTAANLSPSSTQKPSS